MLKCLKKIDKKATGLVAAGVLLGTAGVKLLERNCIPIVPQQFFEQKTV